MRRRRSRRYARAHRRTLKTRAAGYEVGGRRYLPLLVPPYQEPEPLLSFET